MDDADLAIIRRAYARQILGAAGLDDPRLEAAFAAVRREAFLGRGPWQIWRGRTGYRPTPGADPVYLYTDDVVAIDTARQLNNGQPSLHAHLLGQARLAAGDQIVHIGTGTGYYTALMAELAGADGRVTGLEFEADLAAAARANLSAWPQAGIIHGDGAALPLPASDVVYVNAGATGPSANWLDALKEGGRLILPLTAGVIVPGTAAAGSAIQAGLVLLITRHGDDFSAWPVSGVGIYSCAGARDAASEAALAAALTSGRAQDITRLYRHGEVAEEDCWLRGAGWSFAYR